MMHEQITQFVRFLKTAGGFEGCYTVKMLQNLPMRHRDNRVALGFGGIGLLFNPS